MTKQRACCAIAIALVAAVPAGCGSSSKSSSNAPTKAEFLKKGNAICKKGNAEIAAAGKKTFKGKPTKAQQLAFTKQTVLPSIKKQVDEIDAMTPPKGDEAKVKAIVDSANAALKKGEVKPQLLLSNQLFAGTNKLTNAYGLKVCGSDS